MTPSGDQQDPVGQPPPGQPPPHPGAGAPPPAHPGWGHAGGYGSAPPWQAGSPPGHGAPPGYGAPSGYGAPPGYGAPVHGAPDGKPSGGRSFSAGKLSMADWVVAGGALLYLVVAFFPWASISFDFLGTVSASGYGFSGLVTFSAILLIAAAVWALLPAFRDVPVAFPPSLVTVGLAGLALLLTLITWLRSFDYGFEFFALLGFLLTVAVAGFAALTLLPELGNRPHLRSGLSNAAQWANQQAPQFGSGGGRPPRPGPSTPGAYGQPAPGQYGQPTGYGSRPPSSGLPPQESPDRYQGPRPGGATAADPGERRPPGSP